MMANRLTLILAVLWSCCPMVRADETALQSLPKLTIGQGRALVRLAREGMNRYLTHRIRPETMPIPAELQALRGRSSPVAVTLRSRGAVVAVQVRMGAGVCRNMLAAALRAMRSPKLPDRVDRKVLDALTVEVEVLSAPQPAEKGELAAAIIAGLTGLVYSRGEVAWAPATDASAPRKWRQAGGLAWVLPSAGYVLGLDAEQMRRAAMLRYRLTPQNAALPPRLAVFTTRHYVGYPGGRTVELLRGKDLAAREGIDDRALQAAAEQVGGYLLRHQGKDGRYRQGDQPASLPDHLYAAYAMARLAGRRPNRQLAGSAAAAAKHAASLITHSGDRVLVQADRPEEALAATALLTLALAEAPPGDAASDLRAKLHRGLLAELARAGPSSAASRPAAAAEGAYIALLAVAGDRDHAEHVRGLRKAFARITPADFTARLWACRAGLIGTVLPAKADGPADASGGVSQLAGAALPDEAGGFSLAGAPPSALHTGLAAVCLAEVLKRSDPAAPAGSRELAGQLAEARRFCYRMMYQPGEAYFSETPEAWVGGVRATPARAAVSVSACAAAIEAFLAD
jgi:AMMECR1 domain-containing protein